MKAMSLIYAGLLFVVVAIAGTGWYGGMVSDYERFNTSSKINSTDWKHNEILTEIEGTQGDMESGLRTGIWNIPIIGGILVQVFSTYQILRSYILSLWAGVSIGADLITSMDEMIPYVIHPTILRVVEISLVLLFIGSIIFVFLKRRVD